MKVVAIILLLSLITTMGATLYVTDFGAAADVTNVTVNVVSNSTAVTATQPLAPSAVGKILTLFGAGKRASATNAFADLVAQIVGVSAGTNLILNKAAGRTSPVQGFYATCSSTGFQAAVNAAASGDTISTGSGTYLLIAPVWDTNWMAINRSSETAVVVRKGGFKLVGPATLLGNGACQFTGSNDVFRGYTIGFDTVTNDGPIVFENLVFDGGVTNGAQTYKGFPANNDGDGWDVTHGAVLSYGAFPLQTNISFSGCTFQHWRGEIAKMQIGYPTLPGVCNFTNCIFSDGNASGINVNYGGTTIGCRFTNLNLVAEIYQGYAQQPFNVVSNFAIDCANGITVVGAHSNSANAPYLLEDNTFKRTGWGLIFGPAQNLVVRSNRFEDLAYVMLTSGYAYQSIAPVVNSNILVVGNSISNATHAFYLGACGLDSVVGMAWSNNTAEAISSLASGNGCATNVVFVNNFASAGIDGILYAGQWFKDSANQAPAHSNADPSGQSNLVSYAYGMRHTITASQPGSTWTLDASQPAKVPAGASMLVTNLSGAAVTVNAVALANNQGAQWNWTGNAWQLAAVGTAMGGSFYFRGELR